MDSDDYWEDNLLSTVDGLVTNISDMVLFHFARVDEKGQKTPCVATLLPQ